MLQAGQRLTTLGSTVTAPKKKQKKDKSDDEEEEAEDEDNPKRYDWAIVLGGTK